MQKNKKIVKCIDTSLLPIDRKIYHSSETSEVNKNNRYISEIVIPINSDNEYPYVITTDSCLSNMQKVAFDKLYLSKEDLETCNSICTKDIELHIPNIEHALIKINNVYETVNRTLDDIVLAKFKYDSYVDFRWKLHYEYLVKNPLCKPFFVEERFLVKG